MKKLELHEYTKVLVSATSYDFKADKRILIPFTSGDSIGFMDNEGYEIVKPVYSMYYGDCYSEDDFIIVTKIYTYGYQRSGGNVATYHRPKYGLLNSRGKVVMPVENYSICKALGNKKLFTVQREDRQYGVVTADGREIVPFGKYDWIGGFDNGYARVKVGKNSNSLVENGNKWGIIDENGNEVLPVIYDDVWNFFRKGRKSTSIVKDGVRSLFVFPEFKRQESEKKNWTIEEEACMEQREWDDSDEYGSTFGEFSGSYAQDVMDYSDDVINDAFDGEPDAYWNID